VNALRLRILRRAAALAALLAFAALPHGHLRGHEEIADALASVAVAAPAVAASTGAEAPPHGCPLCLSLASVQNALVPGAALPISIAPLAERLAPAPVPLRTEARGVAPSAPRAPPLV
jgi:hypothetical protein